MDVYKKLTKEQTKNRIVGELSEEQRTKVRSIVNSFRNYFVNKHT